MTESTARAYWWSVIPCDCGFVYARVSVCMDVSKRRLDDCELAMSNTMFCVCFIPKSTDESHVAIRLMQQAVSLSYPHESLRLIYLLQYNDLIFQWVSQGILWKVRVCEPECVWVFMSVSRLKHSESDSEQWFVWGWSQAFQCDFYMTHRSRIWPGLLGNRVSNEHCVRLIICTSDKCCQNSIPLQFWFISLWRNKIIFPSSY